MRNDLSNWSSLTVEEISKIFSNIPMTWCIAGGWALDLHLGYKSRQHHDIDVFIMRDEQLTAYGHLKKNWVLYKAQGGNLTIWEEEDFLNAPDDDIWVSKNEKSPWAFQIMLVDSEKGNWVYKRENSITRKLDEIFLKTSEGIPYLKPEIQLLYKGGVPNIREKDEQDFHTLLPSLSIQEKIWLKTALEKQFQGKHRWIKYLG